MSPPFFCRLSRRFVPRYGGLDPLSKPGMTDEYPGMTQSAPHHPQLSMLIYSYFFLQMDRLLFVNFVS